MPTPAPPPHTGAALVGSTGTTVLLLVIALVALGAAMIVVAVWLVRATRSDPPALGPLEAMAERRYRRADASGRAAHLDTARPAGAPPPAPIVPSDVPDDTDEPDEPDEPDESDPASADAEIGEPTEQQPAPPTHDSQPATPAAGEPVEETR